ncbi:cytochrome c oxidase subunit 3 [Tistrella mobilis]|uniref:cytochrome c oxidase subunit 3 n=1 Tax=Tistrella mobilis TaxID=171437 RepID=UPI0035578770
MAENVRLHDPYARPAQQRTADLMGMFVFLGTEIMLFGGLFAAIYVVRGLHPHEVVAASRRLHLFIGAANTAILLTSSLAVAVAVRAARAGRVRLGWMLLLGAALTGLLFLGVKGMEWGMEAEEGLLPFRGMSDGLSGPVDRLFMNLYMIATGLHAIHVSIGVVLLAGLALRIGIGRLQLPERAVVVEVAGLYWHLVDVIWVFLYPALYLIR